MNLFIKLIEIENKLKVNKRERKGRDELEVQDYQIHTFTYKIDNDLLYNIRNYIQYIVITYNGKESEKECVFITESLCCTLETKTL